jgi:hypothetical protein
MFLRMIDPALADRAGQALLAAHDPISSHDS